MIGDHIKLYKSLNKNRVKYLVLGGIAALIYGVPRTTLDIDIFIEASLTNAQRLLNALQEIGFGTAYLTTPEKIIANEITIFEDYLRLDILTKVKGIFFSDVWKRRVIKDIKNVRVKFTSLPDLILSKEAAGRKIDKEDLKILKSLRSKK